MPPLSITRKNSTAILAFSSRLSEKLKQRNQRMQRHLQVWAELLDTAGWCVALAREEGVFWLSPNADAYLEQIPADWPNLIKMSETFPHEVLRLKNECLLVWSDKTNAQNPPFPAIPLTRREAEVFTWIQQGKTSPEIAIILGCSPRTVEKHAANLYRKIGTRNRAEVILNNNEPRN